MAKKAALLLNIGTPLSPETGDVAAYLREFLMDPDVIGLPAFLRWPLVNLAIVPWRAPRSAEKYRKIWTPTGSPLRVHGEGLAKQVEEILQIPVACAMHYGSPGITDALASLDRVAKEILVLPLYPQNAAATVGSGIKRVRAAAAKMKIGAALRFLPPFYDNESFLESWKAIYIENLPEEPDHVLFSFHGLPVNQQGEYTAQCHSTAQLLAKKLSLEDSNWSISFQSRLGRGEWIRPYTVDSLAQLARSGKRKLAVLCPAFVADCLETLEEIGMEGQKVFRENGGEKFALIPCLNSHPTWVESVAGILREKLR